MRQVVSGLAKYCTPEEMTVGLLKLLTLPNLIYMVPLLPLLIVTLLAWQTTASCLQFLEVLNSLLV